MGDLTSYLERCEQLDNPTKKLNMLFAVKALDLEDHLLEKEDQMKMEKIVDSMNLCNKSSYERDGHREMSIEGALAVAEPYIEHAMKLEKEIEKSRKPYVPGESEPRTPPDAVEQISAPARMIRGANLLIQTYFPDDKIFDSALQISDERGDFSIYRNLVKKELDKRQLACCYEADCQAFQKQGISSECSSLEEYEKKEKSKLYENVLERGMEQGKQKGTREKLSFQDIMKMEENRKGTQIKDGSNHNHERARGLGDLGRSILRGSGGKYPGKR